ncbi:amidohydrolase [Halomonas denitrificans]|uniref:amidohydrolase n=1 Tax=Halomonas TaxID=2745 RepID=UPI001C9713CC|nr:MULTISPECIES: amidohydrolase [Halomonas]MBY5982583.1 amidohydrolase [Halomonas sp. DP5Y7-2]MBY6208892.1 amidohydrolase [Halomonas sp. DP3Y7-2]MBY6227362.1 amidohydrolase [Halomonas sp. DP3Y7-1]MCA0914888.1 amidohydrolase [Halomonas denitrificans]MCA0974960.1 amidohydrolase [Halomonas denitrificans]
MSIVVYPARRVLTMNPSQPRATHVAVHDDRILAVGGAEDMPSHARTDDQFADKVILPGFVEGHSHALEGAMWDYLYLGFFPRQDHLGQQWSGLETIAQVQQRLRQHAATLDEGEPLIAWGFDPVYFPGQRLSRRELDEAVADRPLVILHASFHSMTVNSVMLELSGIEQGPRVEGVRLDDQGRPNGELQEMAAMFVVFDAIGNNLFNAVASPQALKRYGTIASACGVTTITDLYNPMTDEAIEAMREATQAADFPVRLVPAMGVLGWSAEEGIARLQRAKTYSHDRLVFGPAKLMTDGSIQGYTARLKWPHYHDGHANGMWNADPAALTELVQAYHQAGLQLHIHTNGDEAVELMLEALTQALTLWPRPDHRHTLQHCQVIDHAQLRRAARLELCLNMFANHIYYWGDIHLQRTLGPSRCQRLEPLASARRLGIMTAIHSDAPVTPLGPLFTAWCAVNRTTASGRQLGEQEAVSVEAALEMITLGAAFTLGMDDRVGSLEVGKFADMAVLDQDPLEQPAEALRDIRVHATMLGGRIHQRKASHTG